MKQDWFRCSRAKDDFGDGVISVRRILELGQAEALSTITIGTFKIQPGGKSLELASSQLLTFSFFIW